MINLTMSLSPQLAQKGRRRRWGVWVSLRTGLGGGVPQAGLGGPACLSHLSVPSPSHFLFLHLLRLGYEAMVTSTVILLSVGLSVTTNFSAGLMESSNGLVYPS